ncbi:MAG TPA: glycosyltransferase 87 family protein [Acidimicrobiales bacterium]|nr:glycosyltransferase 87 family protein [Acidimicrobiales bacterium]
MTPKIRIVLGTGIVLVLGLLMLHWASGDVQLYEHYGAALRRGRLTHGLPKEYPALAGALFVLPLYLGLPYQVAFGVLCLACLLGLLAAACRLLWESERALWFFLASLCLGATWAVFRRYDVFPALTVVVAVGAARSGRWRTAWAATIGGTLLKIFPAFLLPGFFLIEWRRTGSPPWRRAAASAAVVLAVGAAQQAIAPGTVLNPLLYELHRGFEFSSVPGSLAMLFDPGRVTWQYGYGSWQVVGGPAGLIAVALLVGGLLGLAWIWRLSWRGRLEVVEVSLGALSVVVLIGKAFPPQYILWVAPLWAATAWDTTRAARAIWLLTCALTTATYPLAFALAPGSGDLVVPSLLAAARNLALLAATIVWLADRLRRAPSEPDVPGIAGGSVASQGELRPRSVVQPMLGR